MPIKNYKPTSPGRRGMSVSTFEEITSTRPERSLSRALRKNAGRNAQGKVTGVGLVKTGAAVAAPQRRLRGGPLQNSPHIPMLQN